MKRIASLVLLLGVTLWLSGCGEQSEKSEAAKAKEKEIVEAYNNTKYQEENDISLMLEVVNATNRDFGA